MRRNLAGLTLTIFMTILSIGFFVFVFSVFGISHIFPPSTAHLYCCLFTIVWTGIEADLALGGTISTVILYPQSSSIHSHPLSTVILYPPIFGTKMFSQLPASVQADFHWAGLQMKAQSHKIHTFKWSRIKDSPWYFPECTLHKFNGETMTGVHRLFPCFLTSQAE